MILALYCIPTDKATFYAGYPPAGQVFSRPNGLPKKNSSTHEVCGYSNRVLAFNEH